MDMMGTAVERMQRKLEQMTRQQRFRTSQDRQGDPNEHRHCPDQQAQEGSDSLDHCVDDEAHSPNAALGEGQVTTVDHQNGSWRDNPDAEQKPTTDISSKPDVTKKA
jgi:hypothetical protein